jgi:hypothetical protein
MSELLNQVPARGLKRVLRVLPRVAAAGEQKLIDKARAHLDLGRADLAAACLIHALELAERRAEAQAQAGAGLSINL